MNDVNHFDFMGSNHFLVVLEKGYSVRIVILNIVEHDLFYFITIDCRNKAVPDVSLKKKLNKLLMKDLLKTDLVLYQL